MRVGFRLPSLTVDHKVVMGQIGKKNKTHPWDIHHLGIQVPYEEKDNSGPLSEQCWAILIGLADRPLVEVPGKKGPTTAKI